MVVFGDIFMVYKCVSLDVKVKLRLDGLKLCVGDSYGGVISRLIDFFEKNQVIVSSVGSGGSVDFLPPGKPFESGGEKVFPVDGKFLRDNVFPSPNLDVCIPRTPVSLKPAKKKKGNK